MSRAVMPLDVLLRAMRHKWDQGDHDGAAVLARHAAPYVHPRMGTAPAAPELRMISDDELDRLCRADG